MARTGGFFAPAGFSFSAMLFFNASIKSITGAILVCCTSATSCPACFAAIIAWLRYLRQSPEAREVLAVTEDGTPDTVGLALPGATGGGKE